MRSSIMANDTSHRKEFKEQALKRVQAALTTTAKKEKAKPFVMKDVVVRGLEPKRKGG